ncbi:hypothetical protein [Oculatella sp. LEGE 06141]|nr:hypothetical protein [Oculatella sp. LEGE 06141]
MPCPLTFPPLTLLQQREYKTKGYLRLYAVFSSLEELRLIEECQQSFVSGVPETFKRIGNDIRLMSRLESLFDFDCQIQCTEAELFVIEPNTYPNSIHREARSTSLVEVGLAVDYSAKTDDGAMEIFPSSHLYPVKKGTVVRLTSGDLIVFHPGLSYRFLPNRSSRSRSMIFLSFA